MAGMIGIESCQIGDADGTRLQAEVGRLRQAVQTFPDEMARRMAVAEARYLELLRGALAGPWSREVSS